VERLPRAGEELEEARAAKVGARDDGCGEFSAGVSAVEGPRGGESHLFQ
jgi:hypothetical protein